MSNSVLIVKFTETRDEGKKGGEKKVQIYTQNINPKQTLNRQNLSLN